MGPAFYGPLFESAKAITAKWLIAWGVGPGAIRGFIAATVSVLLFEVLLSRERKSSASWRVARIAIEGIAGAAVTIAIMFIVSFVYYAPSDVLLATAEKAAQRQHDRDMANMPKPEARRFGYQEARLLIPVMLDLPRPCTFRVIAAPENINLRGDFITLAQTSTAAILGCVLIEDSQDREPNSYEQRPSYSSGRVVISVKPSWSALEDNLVVQFRMIGFHEVIHGKRLSTTNKEDLLVVFGAGSLW
jgi:hypothetical protein